MPRSGERGPTESGVVVYPKLPVPKPVGRESEPKLRKGEGGSMRTKLIIGGVVLVAGLVLGFILRPMVTTDPRIGELENAIAASQGETAAEKQAVAKVKQELDQVTAAKATSDKALAVAKQAEAQLANQQRDAADRTKELEKLRDKLKAAGGAAAIDGDHVKLAISTAILFKGTEDALTDRGKALLDKLAVPLKEMTDRQIWIIGHTDDTPPPQPKAPKPQLPPPPKKGQKAQPPQIPTPPVSRFPTNWELASLRALAVLHHFQDSARLDPTRLASQTFGQYKPASRSNKALNRRIEIVIAPKLAR